MKEELEALKKRNQELLDENTRLKIENQVCKKQFGVTLKFSERLIKFCAGVNAPEAETYTNLLQSQLAACNNETILEEAMDEAGLEVEEKDESYNSEMNERI